MKLKFDPEKIIAQGKGWLTEDIKSFFSMP